MDNPSDQRVLLFAGQRQYFHVWYFQGSYSSELFKFPFFYVFMTLKLAVTFEYIQNNPCLRVLFDLT